MGLSARTEELTMFENTFFGGVFGYIVFFFLNGTPNFLRNILKVEGGFLVLSGQFLVFFAGNSGFV